jgi:hypothetical protein
MAKIQKLSLIASLIFVAALSLPRLSYAGSVEGTWTGVETYSIVQIPDSTGQPVPIAGGTDQPSALTIISDPGSFSMSIQDLEYPLNQFSNITFSGLSGVFGSTAGSGGGYSDGFSVSFSVTYASISADGTISNSPYGISVADAGLDIRYGGEGSGEEIINYGFQTLAVPEPSSVVLAALAVLVIGIIAWMRGVRLRLSRMLVLASPAIR